MHRSQVWRFIVHNSLKWFAFRSTSWCAGGGNQTMHFFVVEIVGWSLIWKLLDYSYTMILVMLCCRSTGKENGFSGRSLCECVICPSFTDCGDRV